MCRLGAAGTSGVLKECNDLETNMVVGEIYGHGSPARLGHVPDLLVGDGKGREEGWMVNGHYARP